MATVKWSAFTSGTTITGSDIAVGLQSGANVQWTMTQLKTWTSASPTLVTPTLGVATATSINKVALTAPATGSTLTIADGKTLTASNSITLAGTDATTMTFPGTSATIARTDAANTFTGAQTIAGGTVNGTVLDISQTWGSTGTYTGISYDVTDSGPANAASLLVNFRVGGSSKFSINKAGTVTFSNGVAFSNASGADMGTNSIIRIGSLQLGPGSDAIITRADVATFQLGAADAASPVAQKLRVQSSSSTNNNGVDWTIIGSKSAGSGTSGNIIFKTGATGAASGTTNTTVTALTITPATTNNTNTGYPSVVVGAGAAVATNATDGFLYIPTCAGTPTGTPTTQTGAAPLVVDSSNNKLYVFVGGAWTAMN